MFSSIIIIVEFDQKRVSNLSPIFPQKVHKMSIYKKIAKGYFFVLYNNIYMKKIKLLAGLGTIATLGGGAFIATSCNSNKQTTRDGTMEALQWEDADEDTAAYPVVGRAYTLTYYVLKVDGKAIDYSTTPVDCVTDTGSDADLNVWTDGYIYTVTPKKSGTLKMKLKVTLWKDANMKVAGDMVNVTVDLTVKDAKAGIITANKENIDALKFTKDDEAGARKDDKFYFDLSSNGNKLSDVTWKIDKTKEDNNGTGRWSIEDGVLTINSDLSTENVTNVTITAKSKSQPEANTTFIVKLKKGIEYKLSATNSGGDVKFDDIHEGNPYEFKKNDRNSDQTWSAAVPEANDETAVWIYEKVGGGLIPGLSFGVDTSANVLNASGAEESTATCQITVKYITLSGSNSLTFWAKVTHTL